MALTPAQRNPVAIRAAIVAAVTALAHLAVVFGLLDDTHAGALVDTVGPLIDLGGLVVLVVWARAGVTPNAKVVTRVTTDGAVVTGDAAATIPGTVLNVSDDAYGVHNPHADADVAVVEPVLVNPELVAVPAHD